jgi:hypothetical protein
MLNGANLAQTSSERRELASYPGQFGHVVHLCQTLIGIAVSLGSLRQVIHDQGIYSGRSIRRVDDLYVGHDRMRMHMARYHLADCPRLGWKVVRDDGDHGPGDHVR